MEDKKIYAIIGRYWHKKWIIAFQKLQNGHWITYIPYDPITGKKGRHFIAMKCARTVYLTGEQVDKIQDLFIRYPRPLKNELIEISNTKVKKLLTMI